MVREGGGGGVNRTRLTQDRNE